MIRGSDWWGILVRWVLVIVVVVTALYFYRRYEVVHLGATDDSMEIVKKESDSPAKIVGFPRGELVLLDLSQTLYERNSVVAFLISRDVEFAEEVRLGRVLGLPVDILGKGSTGLLVNGIQTGSGAMNIVQIPEGLLAQGVLFENQYLLFNDNPNSMMPDSRSLGAVRREQIRGIAVRNWPW